MGHDDIPFITLIADISLVQESEAKSISYQKFNWQPQSQDSNPSCVDSPDSVNFVPAPSLFNEQLDIIPSETSTRAVFLILSPIESFDRRHIYLGRAALLPACNKTYEILETRYNSNTKFGLGHSVSDTAAPGASQLRFDLGETQFILPGSGLRWTINESGNCKTIVVYYRMWMGKYDSVQNSGVDAIRKSADTIVQSLITNLNDFTNLDTKFIESSLIEWLFPLIRDLEAYFFYEVGGLKNRFQYWLVPVSNSEDFWPLGNESQGLRDAALTTIWIQFRGVIEGFELITQKLEDYQEGTLGIRENDKIQAVINRHRKRLQRARKFEQYVRDTLQWNVGRASLIESRKSIQQSNTLGKLSVLAFIFLPISLATSFLGMNIKELTGSGASWKAFFIAAGILCGLGFLTFLWVFRKSNKFKFCALLCFLPTLLVFWCLEKGLKLMNMDHGLLLYTNLWRSNYLYEFKKRYRSLFSPPSLLENRLQWSGTSAGPVGS
ncbi:hypothetical protein BOTCAL_0193g00130 [Botryotinia calthae]|uniref:Uncharacterized protein n=1 Tax=Botryotinia calthae TaxID=38488 RepID=A0A4Y8D267_9HELO|nr:hypothetical protein BOTCAL_0193g00130 [Botryotinia calthae]